MPGVDLTGKQPAGEGLSRTKIAEQGKKGHIGFQRPVQDVWASFDGVLRVSLFGTSGYTSGETAIINVNVIVIQRSLELKMVLRDLPEIEIFRFSTSDCLTGFRG